MGSSIICVITQLYVMNKIKAKGMEEMRNA
jgi:hypothetical protein